MEEEDISTDIDISLETKEKDFNQNEQITPKKHARCHKHHKEEEKCSQEDISKETSKKKLSIHFEELSGDKPVLQSLTSKLFLTADGYEFRRLQQLRSDTASEIIPYDPQFSGKSMAELKRERPSSLNLDADNEEDYDGVETMPQVVFEKVKYKEDVRYLRHTPSTCSLDNYIINDEDEEDEQLNRSTLINTTNNNNNTISNIFCHDNGIMNHDINSLNPIDTKEFDSTTSGLQMYSNHFGNNDSEDDPNPNHLILQQQQSQPQQSQLQPQNHSLPLNVSLGCITDGNYHQLFIGEERDYFYKLTPVVKWDINGNSLEDDDFPEFDVIGNGSPAKSSLRSSSTTLETWLEVE